MNSDTGQSRSMVDSSAAESSVPLLKSVREEKGSFRRFSNLSFITNLITVLSLFFGGALTTVVWLESRIDARVEERIAPYEHFLNGSNLVLTEQYDKAIPELEKAFTKLGVRFNETADLGENWYPVFDSYLSAITNSEDPADHVHRFNRIMTLVENDKISLDAWHWENIGWFYLRIGNTQKARENYSRAIQRYSEKEQKSLSAASYYNLALVDLAEGKIEPALINMKKASEQNSTGYRLEAITATVKTMREEDVYQKLILSYPKFDDSLPRFAQRLEQIYKQQEAEI